MPFSVNACFEKFRKDVVDLDLEQTKTARENRDFVYTNLESLSQKGVLPRLYSEITLTLVRSK